MPIDRSGTWGREIPEDGQCGNQSARGSEGNNDGTTNRHDKRCEYSVRKFESLVDTGRKSFCDQVNYKRWFTILVYGTTKPLISFSLMSPRRKNIWSWKYMKRLISMFSKDSSATRIRRLLNSHERRNSHIQGQKTFHIFTMFAESCTKPSDKRDFAFYFLRTVTRKHTNNFGQQWSTESREACCASWQNVGNGQSQNPLTQRWANQS